MLGPTGTGQILATQAGILPLAVVAEGGEGNPPSSPSSSSSSALLWPRAGRGAPGSPPSPAAYPPPRPPPGTQPCLALTLQQQHPAGTREGKASSSGALGREEMISFMQGQRGVWHGTACNTAQCAARSGVQYGKVCDTAVCRVCSSLHKAQRQSTPGDAC